MVVIDCTPPLPGSPGAELIRACIEGNLVGVLQALREGANPNAWRENEGPAIHSVLAWPRIVEALIEAGAEPHACNYWSERPLEKLASDCQSSKVSLERGAHGTDGAAADEAWRQRTPRQPVLADGHIARCNARGGGESGSRTAAGPVAGQAGDRGRHADDNPTASLSKSNCTTPPPAASRPAI